MRGLVGFSWLVVALPLTACPSGRAAPSPDSPDYNPPPVGRSDGADATFTSQHDGVAADACVNAENASNCQTGGCEHSIEVTNGCEAEVICEVSTDVDPGWVTIQLVPEQEYNVTTRYGAEDDDFEIRINCKYYD